MAGKKIWKSAKLAMKLALLKNILLHKYNLTCYFGIKPTILYTFRNIIKLRERNYKLYKNVVMNKAGLEIGGPSSIFSRQSTLPIYPLVGSLDNCQWESNIITQLDSKTWNPLSPQTTYKKIIEGYHYIYDKCKKPGWSYILDGTNLKPIRSGSYDFVLSSHVLEHIANPLKALKEWKRVLKSEGHLLLVLPHKENVHAGYQEYQTSDFYRQITSMQHLIEDLEKDIGEDDVTHVNELKIIYKNQKNNREKINFNEALRQRCIHHHVFDTKLGIGIINFVQMQIIDLTIKLPYNIIILAKKISESTIDNSGYFDKLRSSPFYSDRLNSPK